MIYSAWACKYLVHGQSILEDGEIEHGQDSRLRIAKLNMFSMVKIVVNC